MDECVLGARLSGDAVTALALTLLEDVERDREADPYDVEAGEVLAPRQPCQSSSSNRTSSTITESPVRATAATVLR
jgi:hypothetical protein